MRATTETLELLTSYYAAMEANRPSEFGAYYAPDMTLTFGNSPTIRGKDEILAAFSTMLDRVSSLGHELTNVWQDDGTVYFESLGRWTLRGGDVLEIKAASVITVRDGKFVDQRIYVDNAPVQEALARETTPI